MVVFYTDGVTEAEKPLGEQFGLERLSELVRRNPSLSAQELMSNIYDATSNFCNDGFNDDVTILVVRCNFETSSTFSS
jgi:sigma-B regulation protein RsbU (phosphoserine phosphatase)